MALFVAVHARMRDLRGGDASLRAGRRCCAAHSEHRASAADKRRCARQETVATRNTRMRIRLLGCATSPAKAGVHSASTRVLTTTTLRGVTEHDVCARLCVCGTDVVVLRAWLPAGTKDVTAAARLFGGHAPAPCPLPPASAAAAARPRALGDCLPHLRGGKGREGKLLHTHEVVGQGPGSPSRLHV